MSLPGLLINLYRVNQFNYVSSVFLNVYLTMNYIVNITSYKSWYSSYYVSQICAVIIFKLK